MNMDYCTPVFVYVLRESDVARGERWRHEAPSLTRRVGLCAGNRLTSLMEY